MTRFLSMLDSCWFCIRRVIGRNDYFIDERRTVVFVCDPNPCRIEYSFFKSLPVKPGQPIAIMQGKRLGTDELRLERRSIFIGDHFLVPILLQLLGYTGSDASSYAVIQSR